jgi:hypothetical protein
LGEVWTMHAMAIVGIVVVVSLFVLGVVTVAGIFFSEFFLRNVKMRPPKVRSTDHLHVRL